MKILTRDEILQADDICKELVEVPEWGGGAVWVKTMTGTERDRFEASIVGAKGERNMVNVRAKIVAFSAVDEGGKRLFSSEDVVELGKKSSRALNRVFSVAQRLSGFSPQDIEDMTKNSSAGPEENSSSD